MNTPARIQEALNALQDLCVDAELHEPERRSLLLAHLPPAFVAQLKVFSRPADQIRADILALHEVVDHFSIWLKNVERFLLTAAHRERLQAWRQAWYAHDDETSARGGGDEKQAGLPRLAEGELSALLVDALAIHDLRRMEHSMPTKTIEECRALIHAMGFVSNYYGWRACSEALSILNGLALRARVPGEALIVHEACEAISNVLGHRLPIKGEGTVLWGQAAGIAGAVVYSAIRYRDDLALVDAGGSVLEYLLIAASNHQAGPEVSRAIQRGIELAETPTRFKNGPNAEFAAAWLRFLLARGRTHWTDDPPPPCPQEAAELVQQHKKAAGIL